ncbi:MAG: hypothetical protein K0U98_14445 [Deltaproteobacteria bacterium]|nr:hypothetical protein [Deltaproteobacteria bacterium]
MRNLSIFLFGVCIGLPALLGLGTPVVAQPCDTNETFDFEHSILVGGAYGSTSTIEIEVTNPRDEDAVGLSFYTLPVSARDGDGATGNREADFVELVGVDVLDVGQKRAFELTGLGTIHALAPEDFEIFAREVAYRDWSAFDHVAGNEDGDLDAFFENEGFSYLETGYRVKQVFDDSQTHGTSFQAFLLTSEEKFEFVVQMDNYSDANECVQLEIHQVTIYDLDKPPVLAVRGTQEFPEDLLTDLNPDGVGFDQFQFNRLEVTEVLEQVRQPLDAFGEPLVSTLDYRPSFTGHSLGAAVAQWLGSYFSGRTNGYVQEIVTFNSPGIARTTSIGGGTDDFEPSRVQTVTHYITRADVVSLAGTDFLGEGTYAFDNNGQPNWQIHAYAADGISNLLAFEKHGSPVIVDEIFRSAAQKKDPTFEETYESVDVLQLYEESPNINNTSLSDICFTFLPDPDYLLFQLAITKMVWVVSQQLDLARNVGLSLTFRGTMEPAREELGRDVYLRDWWYLHLDLATAFGKLFERFNNLSDQGLLLRALSTLITLRPQDHVCFEELDQITSGSGALESLGAAATAVSNPVAADHFWDAILQWDSFILDDLEFWEAPVEAFEAMLYWTDEQWQNFDWFQAQNMTANAWYDTVPGLKLSGSIWKDVDGDGLRDEDEAGMGGETVFVDADPFNGQPDSGERTATTGSDGSWSVIGVPVGTYQVRHDLNSFDGSQQTFPSAGHHEVVGDPGQPNEIIAGLEFGVHCPAGALCGSTDGVTSTTTEINEHIFLRSFHNLGTGLVELDTGIADGDFVCGLVGFQSNHGNINEKTRGDIIQTTLYRSSGRWHVRADFRSHDSTHEDWRRMDVLCIDTSMASYGGPVAGKPFFLEEYENLGDDIRFDTDYRAEDWHCAVVGFSALDGKINASGTSHILYAYPYVDSGTWHLRGEFRTKSSKPESWNMNMLCVEQELVAVGTPAPEKPFYSKRLLDPQISHDVDTGISVEDWVCGVVGMEIYDGDIDEQPIFLSPIIEAYLFEGETSWQADLSFATHENRENWNLDLLCHRRGAATQLGELPTVPRNLAASPGDGSVTLVWEAPVDDGGFPVQNYEFEVRPESGAVTSGSSVLPLAQPIGLLNGVAHFAKVRAVNAVGPSPWTAEVAVTPVAGGTVTATPYFSPGYNVGLSATWSEVSGAVEYRVTHFRQHANGSATSVVTTSGLVSGSGLHFNPGAPEECYFKEATVEALSASGSVLSTSSASICEIGIPALPGVPESFLAVGGDREISLSWDPPTDSNATSYEYSIREFDDFLGTTWTTTGTSGTQGGWDNGTLYYAKVRALNEAGAGEWSDEVGVTPEVTVPSVPLNLSATGLDGSIFLDWDPPLDPGASPVMLYVYAIRPHDGGFTEWSTAITLATEGGFVNGTLYYARVKAVNASGDSPWTAEVAVTPQAPGMGLVATPYFGPNYKVGLSGTWNSVAGAIEFRVTHFRQNACGSATAVLTTTGTTTGSGLHKNCGVPPTSCYLKEVTVEALDSQGNVLLSESASICEIGFPLLP